jgi:NADPH:quinone reductase-like Zn-dependent oxidoreductase
MTRSIEVPERMGAAFIEQLGPPENIRVGELPVPTPGPTDVLVRVAAAAVDPVDTFVRSGAYPTATPFPFVIGRDLVGTVATAGAGAAEFVAGERVWCNSMGHHGRQGAAAGYVAVPAERLYRLPEAVDADTAVAVAHPGATAYLALVTHAGLRAGETVFVGGGAGNVGAAAVVLAVRAGARVVTSASTVDLDYCRSLGADVALDYRERDFARRLADSAPEGIDVHLETSGHHDLGLASDLLAFRGRILLMSGMGARPELPVGGLYTRGGRIVGFAISSAHVAELAAAADRINQLLGEGALVPRGVARLGLEETAEAHRRLEAGEVHGVRLVLHP